MNTNIKLNKVQIGNINVALVILANKYNDSGDKKHALYLHKLAKLIKHSKSIEVYEY